MPKKKSIGERFRTSGRASLQMSENYCSPLKTRTYHTLTAKTHRISTTTTFLHTKSPITISNLLRISIFLHIPHSVVVEKKNRLSPVARNLKTTVILNIAIIRLSVFSKKVKIKSKYQPVILNFSCSLLEVGTTARARKYHSKKHSS